jgi:leader peptidase (prepilin peptidase)/N-methyltransferase
MTSGQEVLLWALAGATAGAALVPVTRQAMNTAVRATLLLLVAATLTAGLFALIAWRLPAWPGLAGYSAFVAVAVPLAIVDVVEHRLPKQFMRAAYAALITSFGLTGLAEGDMGGVLRASIGLTGSLLVYLAIAMAFPGDLGAGDVRLAGVIGWVLAWHGWTTLFAGVVLGAVVGSIVGLAVIFGRRTVHRTQIPAGPAMLLGAVAALVVAGEAPT